MTDSLTGNIHMPIACQVAVTCDAEAILTVTDIVTSTSAGETDSTGHWVPNEEPAPNVTASDSSDFKDRPLQSICRPRESRCQDPADNDCRQMRRTAAPSTY
jgi:hypothetical protein